MESRFRIKFWSSRRVKRNPVELDLHSVPYQTAAADPKQPVFIHQSLGRNLSEKRKREYISPVRAFSYRQAKPGQLPEVGGRPHRGNGPVKLQTSRRLSSGEILVTQQDPRRTLEEIREAEYIVPVKDRRDSRAQSIRSFRSPSLSQQQQHMPSDPASAAIVLHNPLQLPTLSGWGSVPGSSTLLKIPEHSLDPGLTPLTIQSAPDPLCESDSFSPHVSPVDGLGLLGASVEPLSAPPGILKSSASSPISLLEPHEEQNATIQALWKAEYGRLVTMYGQAGVDRNIAELRRDQSTPTEGASSPFILEPLPQPGLEVPESGGVSRSPRTSRSEAIPVQHEDNSDESSHQRSSFISSAGYASSYTTRTSFAETDSVNTREDIRRMVEDMRSTYLKAIESREPPLEAVKLLKKKKQKKRKSTPTATPRTSTAIPPATPIVQPSKPSTPESQERRSISVSNPSPPLHSQRGTRNFSSPVGGINKLPAIEASPSRDRVPDVGLKRADSSTLGALMGEHKRSSIQKRRSKRHSRRMSAQQNLPTTSPSKANLQPGSGDLEDKDVTVLDEEFQNLYKDIFRTSTHDFWQSQPMLIPTISTPPSIPSPNYPPPPIPF